MIGTPEQENELTDPLPSPFLLFQTALKRVLSWVGWIGFDIIFVGVMSLVLGLVLITHGVSLKLAQASVLYPIGMMFFLLLSRSGLWFYRHLNHQNGSLALPRVFLQTLRDWIPFILIDFIYENLHDLSQHFNTFDVAGIVMKWDIKIFGVEPTLWSQKFFQPLLTDYMALAYALYFIFPLLIMYFLSYRNFRHDLREIILALSLSFLIGFLGYVFFPCSPPRYFIEHEFTQPVHLYGYYLYNYLQNRWDGLSVIRSGAFPSLHVTVSSIALIYAFRFRKRSLFDQWIWWIYLPLIMSLWASTIYLRHHWFIDIVAGWLLAVFCCWISPSLTTRWEELK